MKVFWAALIALCFPFQAAADVLEPEACILDTLKGGASKETVPTIRVNCIRQYILAKQKDAINLPSEKFKESTLGHVPAVPGVLQERIVVSLKNNSNMRIIQVDVVLTNKKTKATHQFRALADTPIDPAMLDTLTAIINAGIKNFDDWTWDFSGVWGVPIKTN